MHQPQNLDVWVLAGQSNMEGRGPLKGALKPDPRVWSFNGAGAWEQAAEPLHLSAAERAASAEPRGAGPGLSFGIAMADALGRPIGLIPCARGGTSLHEWSEMEKGSAGSLYGAMLERIGRAGGRLRGVLWYQGESDTNEEADACSYAARFDRWIAALHRDTDMPDLPVAVVQIGRVLQPKNGPEREPGWDTVREALRKLPERIPHTAVTSAVDLPLCDSIHVSTEGLIRLGRRLARLALRLTGRVDISAGPRVREIESWTTPDGGKNGLRVTFDGVTGGWTRTDSIGGFAFHPAEPGPGALPPMMINARVDAEAGDHSVLILLDREPGPGERVSYAASLDPRCDLVDRADMPLCSFLPRPVD